MSKRKKTARQKDPFMPETTVEQQGVKPIPSPMDMMREGGFDASTDNDFEPTWDDIEKFIALMRLKYDSNED